MNWKIPLFKIYWDKSDLSAVESVVRSGKFWAEGQEIREFEEKLAVYIGRKYCAVFNSGTSALHALLSAYGIDKGDEVIVPSFTFISTANAPLFVGARPVFADIEVETFGLDPQDVEIKITPKTKAIIPVHFGGCPCRIDELRRIAQKHNVILIEDSAESLGAKLNNKMTGTFGEAAMLSFCQNKIIATGEGGAAVTDSRKIYEKMKLFRSHGRLETENYFSSVRPFDYINLGYNFRMPTLIAALGLAQLKKVSRLIRMRRACADYYTARLAKETPQIIPFVAPRGFFNVYQLYPVMVGGNRDALMAFLAKKGIMTKVYFSPVHKTYFYKKMMGNISGLSVTEKISRAILALPFYPGIKRSEMDYVVDNIKDFFSLPAGRQGGQNERTVRK